VVYADNVDNTVGAFDSITDQAVTIAGGGSTPVSTTSWTACSAAQLQDPVAAHYHGPAGLLFVGEATTGNFDEIETSQYVSPTPDSAGVLYGSCRIRALFTGPIYAGRSWVAVSSPPANGYDTVSCAPVTDATTGTCVAGGQNYNSVTGNQDGVIAISHDGGVTWTQAAISGITDYWIQGISCPTNDYCVVAAQDRTPAYNSWAAIDLYASNATSSTPTWTLTSATAEYPSPGQNQNFQSISCLTGPASAIYCQATGNFASASGTQIQSLYSTDGGVTWHEPTTPISSVSVQDVSCTTYLDCLAVGNAYGNGYAFYSGDGGVTWVTVSHHSSNGFVSVSCVQNTTMCLFGGSVEADIISNITLGVNDTWNGPAMANNGYQDITTGVTCTTVSACLIVGGYGNPGYPTAGPSALYSQGAGANSFAYSNIGPTIHPGSGAAQAVSCSNSNSCVLVGDSPIGSAVYVSH
jgi:hypothetical protein